jgi:hypothetical protein
MVWSAAMTHLPPCGLYRTTGPIGAIPAGKLVYFHNHGEPGPGLYLPSGWKANRVRWQPQGTLLPERSAVRLLAPLPVEGFYRVTEAFFCCERRCRNFEADLLVQLGYNAEAQPILFVPELVDGMLAIPERGSAIDEARFGMLQHLKVPATDPQQLH